MSDFDLNALIREVSRADTTGDIALIVKEVRRRIPDHEVETALDQCLHRYVYDVARMATSRAGRGGAAQDEGANAPYWQAAATEKATDSATPSRSSKVRAIREGWRARLDERVSIAPGQSKLYGDCTFDDLEYAAKLRFDLASANQGAGRALKVLGALLREHDVTTVRELPEPVLRDYFGGRRAA